MKVTDPRRNPSREVHSEVGDQVSVEREKVRFPSGGADCAAWHHPSTNGACVIMAGGFTTPHVADGGRALNPGNRYPEWRQEVAARSALRLGLYRPGRAASRGRCPLLVLVCDQDQSAFPTGAVRAARQAHRAELVRLPGGHDAPFLDAHEQAVDAELSFLRRHLLDEGEPAAGTGDSPLDRL